MAPIMSDQPLPHRSASGMTSRAVNAAAGVLHASMKRGRQTPTGLAIDLDSARLLNSPETAAEHERLRAERDAFADRVDTLTAVAKGNKRHVQMLFLELQKAQARVAELEAERLRAGIAAELQQLRARVAELEAAAYGDATVRLLDPMAQIRHLHACVTAQKHRADTLDRLCREQRARADQAEKQLAVKDRPTDEDPICFALTDKAQESADKLTRLFAPTQALQLEDPHDSPLHHDYRVGRDLPEEADE